MNDFALTIEGILTNWDSVKANLDRVRALMSCWRFVIDELENKSPLVFILQQLKKKFFQKKDA